MLYVYIYKNTNNPLPHESFKIINILVEPHGTLVHAHTHTHTHT